MALKEDIFSSGVKYNGIFNFKDFYKFAHDYLTDELGYYVAETKYKEKLSGNSKDIEIVWEGEIKIDAYFKFKIKFDMLIQGLSEIEVEQNGKKIKTNKG